MILSPLITHNSSVYFLLCQVAPISMLYILHLAQFLFKYIFQLPSSQKTSKKKMYINQAWMVYIPPPSLQDSLF